MSELKAGFTDLTEKLNAIEFPAELTTIRDLLPKNVYMDPKYEISQINTNIPQIIQLDNLIANVEVLNNVIDCVKESFLIFAGFENAQEIFRLGRALEDLKTNPLLTFEDTSKVIETENKIGALLKPLSEQISTLRKTDDAGNIVAINDMNDVSDVNTENFNAIKSIVEPLIIKYTDTTMWNTYEAVQYMPILKGGLAVNKFKGSATNALEYTNIGGKVDTFVQFTTPLPEQFNPIATAATAAK